MSLWEIDLKNVITNKCQHGPQILESLPRFIACCAQVYKRPKFVVGALASKSIKALAPNRLLFKWSFLLFSRIESKDIEQALRFR
jgi:hypothetical protein